MAVTEKQEVRDLLAAARSTRNYCMLTGRSREASDRLIEALEPFDGNPSRITTAHLSSLRKAFSEVCKGIDDYTLTQILAGEPPVRIGKPPVTPRSDGEPSSAAGSMRNLLQRLTAQLRHYWPAVWQRAVLPGLAVTLLLLAIHYTQWSFSANLILSRLDRHVETDFHEEVRDLIVVARAIDRSEMRPDDGASNALALQSGLMPGTPAQRQFNQTMSRMRAFHFEDEALHGDGTRANSRFDAINAAWEFIITFSDRFGTDEILLPDASPGARPEDGEMAEEDAPPVLATDVVGLPSPAEILSPGEVSETNNVVDDLKKIGEATDKEIKQTQEAIEAAAAARPTPTSPENTDVMEVGDDKGQLLQDVGFLSIALTANDGFVDTVRLIAERTGRNYKLRQGDHVQSRIELFRIAEELKDKIAKANRFYLPMIYGSLGAALFCLVRVLTPSLSDLGPGRAFLRVLFGAFAAMTLSMLFIPANVFSINSQSNTTMIFLACFLFGYSFDAVLASLHRLEAWLHGRVKTTEGSA